MRFGILKAGTASRRTQARLGDVDAMFRTLLAQPGEQWETFDVEHGEFPARLEGFDGLVITGSASAVFDDAPWIRQLLDTIRAAHEADVPLLGICFGLQACAQALGGEVVRNPAGWDIGLTELTLNEAGRRLPALADAPRPLRIIETHSDIAVRLPPGAVVLASSPRTPFEIFTLGERVLCLQGHPEMDNDMVSELLEKRLKIGLFDEERAAEGRASLQQQPHRAFLQGWLRAYLHEAAHSRGRAAVAPIAAAR
jgi:GMP synthase-like glutamine amidotransferase